MGIYKSQLAFRSGVGQPHLYFCDATSEMPSSGLLSGADILFCHETKTWHVATSSTQWGAAGGGGESSGSGIAYREFTLFADAVGATVSNAATTGTEPANNVSRSKLDLTGFSDCRALFISSLNSTLISCLLQYSTDQSSWSDLAPEATAVNVANGVSVGAFGAIPAGAKGDVFIRALVKGNGTLDPIIRKISLQVK